MHVAFDGADVDRLNREWGFNCGPAALAVLAGTDPMWVREAVESVGFGEKRYMNPSMMVAAASRLGVALQKVKAPPAFGLAWIQWSGPWTDPEVLAKRPLWAYRFTHWIVTEVKDDARFVFDVNGGVMPEREWITEVVPRLTATIPRASGKWYVRERWEVVS